ncbi:MAG: protease modulator HflC, partial [Nitrospiria bacterium]
MTKQLIALWTIAALIVLFLLGAWPFFVVDLTQTAIVIQLGKPVRTITEPGLRLKIPSIQNVVYFDKRLLDYDAASQDVITTDKKSLLIDNFAKWRIKDPLKVYEAFQTQQAALARLDDIIYSELRVELGRHTLTEIISKTRADIMSLVTTRANEKAAAYGIEVEDVRVKRADLPEQNEKAVFMRMQAEREQEAKRYRSEGAEEAQKIRSGAEKEREIILAEAYKTAQGLMGGGDGQAFKTYAKAYRQDPDFFEFTR